MRRALHFEAIPERPNGSVLLELAIALRQLNLNPEELTWKAAPSGGSIALRLVLVEHDEVRLLEIAKHMERMPGVRDVRCRVLDAPYSAGDQRSAPKPPSVS